MESNQKPTLKAEETFLYKGDTFWARKAFKNANSLLKNFTEFYFWIFTVYRSNVLIFSSHQLFENENIPSRYFSRMKLLKIKGQNFEAASWP